MKWRAARGRATATCGVPMPETDLVANRTNLYVWIGLVGFCLLVWILVAVLALRALL